VGCQVNFVKSSQAFHQPSFRSLTISCTLSALPIGAIAESDTATGRNSRLAVEANVGFVEENILFTFAW
jgi:hypothetical protein